MGKEPRKVNAVPQGYEFSHRDEATGRDIYKIKTETKPVRSSTTVKKTASTSVLKAPIKRKTPPTITEDFVYIEPTKTDSIPKEPIKIYEDLRIDRKLQPPINPNIDYYKYPDPNAGYSKSTPMYFDKITHRPVDVLKSIGADGTYNPIYTDTLTANEGKYQGTIKQGNPRVTTDPTKTTILEGNEIDKSGTKKGEIVGTTGFKKGGIVSKIKGYAYGGEVRYNYKGEVVDEDGNVIDKNTLTDDQIGKQVLGLVDISLNSISKAKQGDKAQASTTENSTDASVQNPTEGAQASGVAAKAAGKSGMYSAIGNIGAAGAGIGAGVIDSKMQDERGRYKTVESSVASNTLKGAAIGTKIGSNPMLASATGGLSVLGGAALGAAGGAIYGNIKGKKDTKAISDSDAKRTSQLALANKEYVSVQAVNDREAGVINPNILKPYSEKNAMYDENDNIIRGYSEGGDIKGKGGPKSDSIKAEVKEGSFVVPAENAELAKGIRKLYLKAPIKKAKLKQEEGEPVKLSNGEHLFTPEENEYLESIGIDLEDLAPNAEHGEEEMAKGGLTASKARMILHDKKVHGKALTDQQRKFFGAIASGASVKMACGGEVNGYAEGGPVKGTKVDGATWNGKNWVSDNGSVYSSEGGKKFTEKYNQQLSKAKSAQEQKTGAELNVYKRKLKEANDAGNTEEANRLQVKINQLSGLKQSESKPVEVNTKSTSKPSLKAPSVKKKEVVAPFTVNANPDEEVVVPGDNLSPNERAVENKAISDAKALSDDAIKTGITPDSMASYNDKYKKEQAAKNSWINKLANVDPTSVIGIGQMVLGNRGLKGQVRPVDNAVIDPTYNTAVNRAQQDASFGLTPEQNFIANQEINNARRDAMAKGVNFAGGSGVQAFNLNRAAINDAWKNKLGLTVANQEARMSKQKYADAMAADRASVLASNRRQAFNDAMSTFQQKQKAGSELVGAGLQNIIGAYRFNKDQEAMRRANEERNAWTRNF